MIRGGPPGKVKQRCSLAYSRDLTMAKPSRLDPSRLTFTCFNDVVMLQLLWSWLNGGFLNHTHNALTFLQTADFVGVDA